MYNVFERKDIEERITSATFYFTNEEANAIIDAFLFLMKQRDEEAGLMGEDVLYYHRQDKALKTLAGIMCLNNSEIDAILKSFTKKDTEVMCESMLYSKEEYRRYVKTISDKDKKLLEDKYNDNFDNLIKFIYDDNDIPNNDKNPNLNEEEVNSDISKSSNITNPHEFCKGLKIRNKKSKKHDELHEIIGFYLDSNKNSPNYGKYSFAVREIGDSKHCSSFWFPKEGGINENIIFDDSTFDTYYRSPDFLKCLELFKEKLIKD